MRCFSLRLLKCLAASMLATMLTAALLPCLARADSLSTLNIIGSDTMSGMLLRWGELLYQQHPELNLQLKISGSASAPTALTAGTTLIGPMSRPMTEEEQQRFIERHGYPPLALTVARDALVVIVNRHNPLASLSLAEVDAIFSETLSCGGESPIRRWSELGLSFPKGRIVVHGRNAVSGTHGLWRRRALCGGSFRPDINEYLGSAMIVAAVGSALDAIGYTSLNHRMASVRVVPLRGATGEWQRPTPQAVQRGDYPLTRNLWLYINRPPGTSLPPTERAFLELVLSSEGQSVVEELGFVKISQQTLEQQRQMLGFGQPPL